MDRASGTDRAQWLGELAVAIEQAQQLAWTLGVTEGSSPDAKALYSRLEAVRIEVDSLRRGRWQSLQPENDPKWLGLLSWRGAASGSPD